MLDDPQEQIARYQEQINRGQDSDVVSYAAKTLPTLQERLRTARNLARGVGAETQQRDFAPATSGTS